MSAKMYKSVRAAVRNRGRVIVTGNRMRSASGMSAAPRPCDVIAQILLKSTRADFLRTTGPLPQAFDRVGLLQCSGGSVFTVRTGTTAHAAATAQHRDDQATLTPHTGRRHQAAAVDAVESTLPNTSVAFRISSIVPIEIRAWVRANGGKSRPTSTPFARHASRNAAAGRFVFTKMKFACESVASNPAFLNQSSVNWRASVLRFTSAGMCA